MAIRRLVAMCLTVGVLAALAPSPAAAGGAAASAALGLASFAVFNQLAFGLFAPAFWGAPYYAPYYASPYYYPPAAVAGYYPPAPYPAPAYYPPPAAAASPAPQPRATAPARGEVVYAHGRYVLRGDGVTTPYQWVWLSNAPQPDPASAPAGTSAR